MTDRLTPAMRAEIFDMIANAANEASDTDPNPLAALGKSAEHLRDEAARREAEGFVPEAARQAVAVAAGLTSAPPMSDAPPPPAPDDLVRGLRDRARHARAEGNATATSDAWHFEQAADAIEALRADAKRLREALVRIDALDPEEEVDALSEAALRGNILHMGEIARAALAQGGNDGQGK